MCLEFQPECPTGGLLLHISPARICSPASGREGKTASLAQMKTERQKAFFFKSRLRTGKNFVGLFGGRDVAQV